MDFSKQRCLLTGASGGIGQAIAQALADQGASLVLLGRNEALLTELAARLPGEHEVMICDVSQAEQVQQVVSQLAASGGISMLINNAGVSQFGEFSAISDAELQANITTNLIAPMRLTQALLPMLKQRAEGYVVNIGSTFGSIGFACHSVYCASKFGLRGFTEALYRELANTNVKVFYLAPRATQTSINSAAVQKMNHDLGNQVDPASKVAEQLISQLNKGQARRFIGFPESLFVRINGSFPKLVDNALMKKLPIIKRYAQNQTEEVMV
jgi:short-subunit dehydrogenase